METVEGKEVRSKGVVPFQNLPVNEDKPWDAAAARKRLAKWAGGPDKEDMDWAKYRKAFLWFDSKDPENFGSYKFPIADIVKGKLTAIYAAISAAAGRLATAKLPAADIAKMKTHLGKYYKKMGKEPPWAKKQAEAEKVEVTEDFIHVPAPGESGKHKGHKIRYKTLSKKKGIRAKYCIPCKVIVSYVFTKAKGWTKATAVAWVKAHHKKPKKDYDYAEETPEQRAERLDEFWRNRRHGSN